MHSGLFGKTDADCVDDMFVQAMAHPSPDAYQFVVCMEAKTNEIVGFACYGREALTKHTWDVFWICALFEYRGRGVGRSLLRDVVARMSAADAHLIVIYTSSTPPYAPARRLYESQGFRLTATVPNYYDLNDDMLIYSQTLKKI
jgi:ribosomal protein S18 acetylase RimI-like enzyme